MFCLGLVGGTTALTATENPKKIKMVASREKSDRLMLAGLLWCGWDPSGFEAPLAVESDKRSSLFS